MAKLKNYALTLKFQDLYDALAGIRGPDIPRDPEHASVWQRDTLHAAGKVLKLQVTARIRHIFFPKSVEGVGAQWNNNPLLLLPIVEADIKAAVMNLRDAGFGHFVGHCFHAVSATIDHPIWGGTAQAKRLLDLLR